MNKPKPCPSDQICYRFLQRANCATKRRTHAPHHHDSTAGLAAAPTAQTLRAGFTEGQAT